MEIYNEKLRDLLDADFQKTYSSNSNLNSTMIGNTNNSSGNFFNNSFNGTNSSGSNSASTNSSGSLNVSNVLNQINSNNTQKSLKIREHPTKGNFKICLI